MEPLQAIIEQYEHIQKYFTSEAKDLLEKHGENHNTLIQLEAKIDIMSDIIKDLKTL